MRRHQGVMIMQADALSRLGLESLRRLDPRLLMRNPVMFVVAVGAAICAWFTAAAAATGVPFGVDLAITLVLLATVLFANAAEALAEARGKAHASSLRTTREQLAAHRFTATGEELVSASELRRGDRVRIAADELIPCDGEIVEGAAIINESAVTGESAPMLREAGTDHSGVSAGTKVLSNEIVVEVTAERQKTPNDAPALAQADLGLAMNSGTQAAREAANMVDLDSDPGKLIDVVEIGKQLLITRGALTTFSLANDVTKYFVILPTIFAATLPALAGFDVLRMASPTSAVLAAVIFNAIVIPALIPFALRGVRYKPESSSALLRRNALIYGVGGLLLPFPAIKLIDLVLGAIL